MVTCSSCGAQAGAAAPADGAADATVEAALAVPLGWMVEHDRARGRTYGCPACARRHARSIEAKLDQAWW
jgi:hypothetical protein